MEEQLILLGFVVIIIGIVIVFIGSVLTASKSKNVKVDWGFGGFIGFLPFGYWSSKRMMYFVIASSIILFILLLFLTKKLI